MKKILCLFFILPFNIKGQGIIVGDTISSGIVYHNIKDTVVAVIYPSASFDLDGDLVNDIKFNILKNSSPCYTDIYENVTSLNNLEFIHIPTDTIYIDSVTVNSMIDQNLNWSTSLNAKRLLYYTNSCLPLFRDTSGAFIRHSGYLGFKKGNMYGWIYLDCGVVGSIKILSWAYQSNNNGISELNKNSMIVYPNPTSNVLHISNKDNSFENSQVQIINCLGQTTTKQPYSHEVDVSKLPAGIYTLKILTINKQSYFSKFIKE